MSIWNQLKRAVSPRAKPPTSDDGYFVYRLNTPNHGFRDVLSFLPSERVFAEGLARESVLGHVVRAPETTGPIRPEEVRENPAFDVPDFCGPVATGEWR